MKQEEKLTSVKVQTFLFERFKDICYENNFSLKKLVNRGIYLYITDKNFRERINSQNQTKL